MLTASITNCPSRATSRRVSFNDRSGTLSLSLYTMMLLPRSLQAIVVWLISRLCSPSKLNFVLDLSKPAFLQHRAPLSTTYCFLRIDATCRLQLGQSLTRPFLRSLLCHISLLPQQAPASPAITAHGASEAILAIPLVTAQLSSSSANLKLAQHPLTIGALFRNRQRPCHTCPVWPHWIPPVPQLDCPF